MEKLAEDPDLFRTVCLSGSRKQDHQSQENPGSWLCWWVSGCYPRPAESRWGVCVCVCVCVLSHVQLFATPSTVACQDPLSLGSSRQEYWSGIAISSSEAIFPTWVSNLRLLRLLLRAGRFFTTEPLVTNLPEGFSNQKGEEVEVL